MIPLAEAIHFWNVMPEDKQEFMKNEFIMAKRDGKKATNFRAIIFRLIQKADPGNTQRLFLGFPAEVATVHAWHQSVWEEE